MSKYDYRCVLDLISTMKYYSNRPFVSIDVLITLASETLRVLNEIKKERDKGELNNEQ